MVDAKQVNNMVYRYLGNSGIRVSVISWGNWINVRDDENTRNTVKVALELTILPALFETITLYIPASLDKTEAIEYDEFVAPDILEPFFTH